MQNANKGVSKAFDASTYRVGIVVAQFNADITDQMLASALAATKDFKLNEKKITIHRVAGSVEIPVTLRALAATNRYDALIALGAVIRGETDHYDYVVKIVTEGVLSVMMQFGIPVGFGVLTCNNLKQAQARVNSGKGALEAALHCAKEIRAISNAK
jgi:6,7-dimethyl-8-ribityllumazine synthase